MPILMSNHQTATANDAIALANQVGAKRTDDLRDYIATLWKLAPKFGLDPAGAFAQSAYATDGWQDDLWSSLLNPAQLRRVSGEPQRFSSPEDAAKAHIVRLCVWHRGWKGASAALKHLPCDEGWHGPLTREPVPPIAKTYHDLANVWHPDPFCGQRIDQWHMRLTRAITVPLPIDGPRPDGSVPMRTGNRWSPRVIERPLFVVHHISDELSVRAVADWYGNPMSMESAHFLVDRDGSIYHFVGTMDASWSIHGIREPRNDIPELNMAIASGIDINHYCVNVVYVADRNSGVTDAQVRNGLAICKHLNSLYGIAPHRYGQLRHSDVDTVMSAHCPGPNFPLDRMIKELGGDPCRMSR